MSRPLTVVQLLPELNVGGVERGTLQIARALVDAGHRALVISGGGRLVPELLASGAEHITLGVGEKRLGSLRIVSVLRRLFAGEDIDIVHARSRLPAWLARLALGRRQPDSGPAWVTTVHGPYTVNRYSRIMTSGDRVIAISEFIHDYIRRHYPAVEPARIVVIPRGVERERYLPGYMPNAAWRAAFFAAHPLLTGKRLLTLPARLTRWKGQLDFLALLARLRAEGLPVHGLLAGAAHPRKQDYARLLRQRVNELGLIDDVTFLGETNELREVLAISDLVYSLTNEPEAFGRTTIEALSLGVPVIGYAHGGTQEILQRVFAAGLVPPGDIAEAAARTRALLAARPAVPSEHPYTVDNMAAATLALYETLAAARRSARQSAGQRV